MSVSKTTDGDDISDDDDSSVYGPSECGSCDSCDSNDFFSVLPEPDTKKTVKFSEIGNLQVGVASMQGWMAYMEDETAVVEDQGEIVDNTW